MICAGVQNVSRPIDMCHAMSHGPPIIPLATPATMHQIVHGTDSTFAVVRALTRAAIGGRAICCPKGIDCPISCHSFAATTSGFFSALPRVYTPLPILQTTCLQLRPLLSNSVIIAVLLRLKTRRNIQDTYSSLVVRATEAMSFSAA